MWSKNDWHSVSTVENLNIKLKKDSKEISWVRTLAFSLHTISDNQQEAVAPRLEVCDFIITTDRFPHTFSIGKHKKEETDRYTNIHLDIV